MEDLNYFPIKILAYSLQRNCLLACNLLAFYTLWITKGKLPSSGRSTCLFCFLWQITLSNILMGSLLSLILYKLSRFVFSLVNLIHSMGGKIFLSNDRSVILRHRPGITIFYLNCLGNSWMVERLIIIR